GMPRSLLPVQQGARARQIGESRECTRPIGRLEEKRVDCPARMSEPLLRVEDLVTSFHTDDGVVRAVDGVSFDVSNGGTLGVVGERGCGKSVTSLSIMRLLPQPAGVIERGRILFAGKDLARLPEKEMRALRGNRISMIFQEPMTTLNPVHRVGEQIGEAVR